MLFLERDYYTIHYDNQEKQIYDDDAYKEDKGLNEHPYLLFLPPPLHEDFIFIPPPRPIFMFHSSALSLASICRTTYSPLSLILSLTCVLLLLFPLYLSGIPLCINSMPLVWLLKKTVCMLIWCFVGLYLMFLVLMFWFTGCVKLVILIQLIDEDEVFPDLPLLTHPIQFAFPFFILFFKFKIYTCGIN